MSKLPERVGCAEVLERRLARSARCLLYESCGLSSSPAVDRQAA